MSLPSYAGIAGTWTMNSGPEVPPAESSLLLEATHESLFDPDYRALVDPTDYNDGGKYRCKLASYLSLPLSAFQYCRFLTYETTQPL